MRYFLAMTFGSSVASHGLSARIRSRTARAKMECSSPACQGHGRYGNRAVFGLARLDDGTMWPMPWAVTTLSQTDEKVVEELVCKATTES